MTLSIDCLWIGSQWRADRWHPNAPKEAPYSPDFGLFLTLIQSNFKASGSILRDDPNNSSLFRADGQCLILRQYLSWSFHLWDLGRLIHKMLGCEC